MNLGPLVLAGRKASTTPVLTNDLAQVVSISPLERDELTDGGLYKAPRGATSTRTVTQDVDAIIQCGSTRDQPVDIL